jgi:hypothetical protein
MSHREPSEPVSPRSLDSVAERLAANASDALLAVVPSQTIVLSADEQLAFWTALNEAAVLTPAQRRLGELMRSSAMQ